MKSLRRGLVLTVLILFTTAIEAQAGFLVGSSYNVAITNGPDGNVNTNVTLDLTTKSISNNLTVKETLFADGPNSQWIELDFETVNGGPLAGNIFANWQFDITGLDVDTPSLGSGFYFYWSVDDTPVSPISPFGGIAGVAPIPTNPGAGPAYTAIGFPPFPAPDFGTFAFVSPYSFVSVGGIDPNTANGFHMGVRITNAVPTAVPEPASLGLFAIGTVAMAGFGWRRRKQQKIKLAQNV